MRQQAPPVVDVAAGRRLPEAVIDAAIIWGVKLNYGEPTPQTQARFQRWLEADPLHPLAWSRIGTIKPVAASGLPTLGHATLAAAERLHQDHGQQRRRTLKGLSLAALLGLLGWQLRDELAWQRLLSDASTGVGERRMLRLGDGTVLVLNTDSAVSIDLSGERRTITLCRGEMLVTTGSDSAAASKRPFWVFTPFGKMQALGTRFVVRLESTRARISVQQGAVALHPADGGTSSIVYPNQSSWLDDASVQPAPHLPFAEDGFSDGVIAGQQIRLDALLRELARYRRGYIYCDPAVAGLSVSGVFHLDDTDRTLQFLLQTQPVSVTYRTRFWVTVGPQKNS